MLVKILEILLFLDIFLLVKFWIIKILEKILRNKLEK